MKGKIVGAGSLDRAKELIARHEANRVHICGNCRHWAHSDFDKEPNHAPCIWPTVFTNPEPEDRRMLMPPWMETGMEIGKIRSPLLARDRGRNCPVFNPIDAFE